MSLVSVGARSLPTGCPRCAGEHGPRTASDWQAGGELAWLVAQFVSVLHLARCSGMHVWPCGAECLCIYVCANLDSSGAGVTRCHSCLLAHPRSRRVARGVQGSTDPDQHPIGRVAVSLLGSPAVHFKICVLHLARCSGMRVWPCGSACWRIYICANYDSSGAGVTRFHSCLLAHARSRRVARGVAG